MEKQTSCKACPSGIPSSPGSTNCTCGPGYAINSDSMTCEACPIGIHLIII